MLKLAKNGDAKRLKAFCDKHPLGVRIVCMFESYGFDRSFLKVWFSEVSDNIKAVICAFDDSLTLCADEDFQADEISLFLKMHGGKLCCDEKLKERLKIKSSVCKEMFVFDGTCRFFDETQSDADMKSVYELISRSIPNSFSKSKEAYLSFLSDFTFRKRRNKARVRVIESEGKVLSCAITAAESETAALISGVACDGLARGKGFGRKTVESLCFELENEGKTVYVIALNDSAQSFYEKLGFKKCVTVCYADI